LLLEVAEAFMKPSLVIPLLASYFR